MINSERLLQNQIKSFIMESVDKEIVIFNDNLDKFINFYKSEEYSSAEECLLEMRFSALNLFKAISLFTYDLFDSCLYSTDNGTISEYKNKVLERIVDGCINSIKNNLDILNEPFRPDYYYLSKNRIEERQQEPIMENLLFYSSCIFTFISESKSLCEKHIMTNKENKYE